MNYVLNNCDLGSIHRRIYIFSHGVAPSCSQLSLGCSRVDETALEVGDRGLNNLNSVPGCLACVENAGDKVECGDKVGLDVDHEFFNWAEVIHKEVGPVGVNNLGLYSISEDGPGDNIINAVGHTPVMEKPIDIISGADPISKNHQVEEVNITALPIGNCTLALEDGNFISEVDQVILGPDRARGMKKKKKKKKRKTIDEILGFSKVLPVNYKGGRNKQKCVVFRSAVAAAALSASVSENGISNRNKILYDEARAIWAMNKAHGIGYEGDEEKVISKIVEMEEQRHKES